MTTLDIAPTLSTSQSLLGKSLPPIRPVTRQSRRQSNNRFQDDKLLYGAGTNPLQGGGHTFGRARNFGPVPEESRRCLRNRLARLAAILAYIRKLALALIFEAFIRVFRAIKVTVLAANDYDYRWQGDDNVYPFPSTEVYEAPLTPGQILKLAATKKQLTQEVPMVVRYADPLPKPNSILGAIATQPAMAAPPEWASASPSGVTTISTKDSAAILAEARAKNSPYLIDPNRVKLQRAY